MFRNSLTGAASHRYVLNMFKDTATRAVPQRAASEETRRQILDTALGLFREHGFEETTIRDIAGGAGLSLGAAYYYFKSKEAIVGAYYDYVQEEHLTRAREAFARGGDLRERLRAALHTKIDIMQGDRRLLRALFRYGGEPEHPLSWFGPATRQQRQDSVALFAEAFAGERLPDDVRDAAPTLLWTLANPVVTAPIIGPRTTDQLTGSLRALAIRLDDDTRKRIDDIWPGPGGEAPEAYAW